MVQSTNGEDPDAYSSSDGEILGEEVPASLPVEGGPVPSPLLPDSQPLFESHDSGSIPGPADPVESPQPLEMPASALPKPSAAEGANGIV